MRTRMGDLSGAELDKAIGFIVEELKAHGIDYDGMKDWQRGEPEDDVAGRFTNENPGRHRFRYSDRYNLGQRRCGDCGIWETESSRLMRCDPDEWKGAPA
jgi:hypothetical protein